MKYERSALHSGAVGYVVKTVGEHDLLAAIRAVAKGQVFIDLDDAAKSSAVYREAAGFCAKNGLSEREVEVLALLGMGLSNLKWQKNWISAPRLLLLIKLELAKRLDCTALQNLLSTPLTTD